VQRLRLDEARKRLAAADYAVENIAESVGFSDPDSFRRAFVQQFGTFGWIVQQGISSGETEGRCLAAATLIVATYSGSLRFFFRARFRAKACFTRRFSPGFR